MNKEDGFKVVDKRTISNENVQVDSSTPVEKKASEEPKKSEDRPKIYFSIFVHSMTHQAMMALGLVPWHDSGLVKTDLKMASETIEILDMLQEKSKGNLTAEEETLINSLVYQLKIAFVEVSKQNPQKPSGIII